HVAQGRASRHAEVAGIHARGRRVGDRVRGDRDADAGARRRSGRQIARPPLGRSGNEPGPAERARGRGEDGQVDRSRELPVAADCRRAGPHRNARDLRREEAFLHARGGRDLRQLQAVFRHDGRVHRRSVETAVRRIIPGGESEMNQLLMSSRAAVTVTVAAFATLSLGAQSPAPARTAPAAPSVKAKAWTARTADGQPDLTGNWSNATYTPLERPASFAGKEFFTPEEAAAFATAGADRLNSQASDDIHYDDAIWQAENYKKGVSSLRTSLVVDPPDGLIPALTDAARARPAPPVPGGNPADR